MVSVTPNLLFFNLLDEKNNVKKYTSIPAQKQGVIPITPQSSFQINNDNIQFNGNLKLDPENADDGLIFKCNKNGIGKWEADTIPSSYGGVFEIAGTGDNPYSISVDDTGKTAFLTGSATGSQEIILPELGTSETEGLYYKLQIGSDYAGSSRIIEPYGGGILDLVKGSVNYIANGGATAGAADEHIIFAVTANPGDFIELTSFDSKWYVSGQCALDNSIIFGPDPCKVFTLQDSLVGSDTVSGDYFGASVSVRGDYLVVGAYMDDDTAPNSGSAYIFENVAGTWTQVQKCTASDAQAHDNMGWSVAIDGDYMVTGAPTEDAGASNSGACYIYYNSGGFPSTETQKIVSSAPQAYENFGRCVAIEGNLMIIGADGGGVSYSGCAYIFENVAGTWTQTQKLITSDAAPMDFIANNRGVSISGDFLIIGAQYEDGSGISNAGSAYVFENVAGTWTETQKLTASDGGAINDYFGCAVSISEDFLIVGILGDDDVVNAGAAEIFKNIAGTWTFTKKLLASDAAIGDTFGFSVSINGDSVMVGATEEDTGGFNSGAVYLYNRNCGGSDNWGEVQIIRGEAANDNFGTAVSNSSTHAAATAMTSSIVGKCRVYN